MGEVTGVRSHMGGGAGVEEPLRGLWSARRGIGRVQRGEESLMIPGIQGRRWSLLRQTGGERRGWTCEASLVRRSSGTWAEYTSAWGPERHGPGLDHAGPRVVARCPACRRRWEGTAWRRAAPTTAATSTAVVGAGRRGVGRRLSPGDVGGGARAGVGGGAVAGSR